MRITTVTIGFDDEKLAATRLYMAQKDLKVEPELVKAMEGLYAKYVPANVREFIEMKSLNDKPQRRKPAKQEEQQMSMEVNSEQND